MQAILYVVGTLVAIYLALVAMAYFSTLIMGLLIFMAVKTKTPLVQYDAPPIPKALLSLLWPLTAAAGLALISMDFANRLQTFPSMAHSIAFAKTVGWDGLQWMLEAAFAIYTTSKLSKAHHNSGMRFASVGAAATGVVVLSLPMIASGRIENVSDFAAAMYNGYDRFAAGVSTATTYAGRGQYFAIIDMIWRWVVSTGGNMFAICAGVAKAMWVVVILKALRDMVWTGSGPATTAAAWTERQTKRVYTATIIAALFVLVSFLWVSQAIPAELGFVLFFVGQITLWVYLVMIKSSAA